MHENPVFGSLQHFPEFSIIKTKAYMEKKVKKKSFENHAALMFAL